jgi:hypothetical protein
MSDRSQGRGEKKAVVPEQVNHRPNGKAPKKHPKAPVKKRSDEELARIAEAKKSDRQKRYEEHKAEVERQLAATREHAHAAALKEDEQRGRKKRQSASQARRAAAQQAAAQIAAATLGQPTG